MQRKMQNLSFFMIVSVLLSCAFFFSQQSNTRKRTPSVTATLLSEDDPIADIPDCESAMPDEELINCYAEAEMISQRMLEAKVADILALESDPGKRMEFMETQFTWESSRDANCNFLHQVSDESSEAPLREAGCIHRQNLTRLAFLEELFCNWYDPSGCGEAEIVDE